MKPIFLIILIASYSVNGDIDALWNFENFYKYLRDNLQSANISSSCSSELRDLFTNNDTLFDLYDASSKYPWSGLKPGSRTDYGNYDQCINIDHSYSEGKVLGKYCLYGLILHGPPHNENYSLAICMPSGCTDNDYNTLFNTSSSPYRQAICHTKDYVTNYTEGDIALIIVFLVFATVIVISTIYDVYLYKTESKTAHPVYVVFSAFTNLRKLLNTSEGNKEHIQIFDGLRSILMMWILALHNFYFSQKIYLNRTENLNFYRELRSAYICAAHLAVDGFFFMSGFLQAYGYLKQKNTSVVSQIVNIPSLIIQRYIRLTPAMAIVYFTYITIFRHISSGPLVKYFDDSEIETCRKNWLPYFLYYQNYYNIRECLVHTWYLAVSMQLFVISLLILIPVATLLGKNKAKPVMYFLLGFNIVAVILSIAPNFSMYYIEDEYFSVQYRLSSNVIGITMGTFMREKKDKPFLNNIKNKSSLNLGIWIVVLMSMTITALLHFYSKSFQLSQIWCLGLCWMVYSSYHGYGGMINWILTRPTLRITAKTSYCIYILHYIVVRHYMVTQRTKMWFHDYTVFINFCGFFVVTFAISVIWYISFEYPMITLEKLIFVGGIRGEKGDGGEQEGKTVEAEAEA